MFKTFPELFVCQRCKERFEPDEDNEQIKLCYHCFEDSIEEYEERKRERIARENEY